LHFPQTFNNHQYPLKYQSKHAISTMPPSRRSENYELIKLQSSDDGDKHSVWSYRILNPVPVGQNRVSLYDCRGLYNIWGYTEQPTAHVIGLIEFKDLVDVREAEAMIRHQYSGTFLMEPLQGLSHIAKVMTSIKDVNSTSGAWVETHADTDREDMADCEEDSDFDFDDYYVNIDDDDRGGDDPAERHAVYAAQEENHPDPNQFDPVDLGERLAAHI
jgi:hypothetical protein